MHVQRGRRPVVRESTELRELIIGCFRALANGDAEFFERHVICAAELRLIGATSEEWFGGVEGFDLLRQQAANGRGELQSVAEQVEAYSSGDAGWGAAVIRYSYGADQS